MQEREEEKLKQPGAKNRPRTMYTLNDYTYIHIYLCMYIYTTFHPCIHPFIHRKCHRSITKKMRDQADFVNTYNDIRLVTCGHIFAQPFQKNW